MATTPSDKPIRMDDALRRRIEECAEATGTTPDAVVRDAVEEYLSRHGSNVGRPTKSGRRRLGEVAQSISSEVPAGEWEQLPTDLASNFEHYRFGYPRED